MGTGCANCKTTLKLIEQAAEARSAEIELEKVEDLAAIIGYGVMSAPGVVVNGKVVHTGGIPSMEAIDSRLGDAAAGGGGADGAGNGRC